ncbi:NmrA family NAD(P)-binding protein [Chitinophaga sedimenti]|uniref:NmrA family NAD(P)-binding protein n=1 Tax=Chitinophaga sedimenti TaxID=2033606 RepID=UPI002005FA38|nr:NmrA family NAD(P)-binding protein [Chitinophaga sedimenti]MCK7560085.1 NmrA family NAD(P)-binding protein [Chitinophaga sedimenti]
MKIIVTGSLGNIGLPLTQKLVAAGHDVTVVSSQSSKSDAITALGATPAIGSVSDAAFLQTLFTGADAVWAMTPPNMGGSNVVDNTVNAGKAYATAIAASGVKRVVMLSSIGADLPAGTGPIKAIHQIENIYRELEGVNVTFLRAGYFYINFYNDVPLIQHANIIGGNFPADVLMPLVHPEDIATAAAAALQQPGNGKDVQYIVSDVRTPADVARVFGAAIGKPGLPWVEFTDAQAFEGMTGAGVPKEIAELYTEMGAAFHGDRLAGDFVQTGSPVNGKVKLEAFAVEFAGRF